MLDGPAIISHINQDADSRSSIWAARKFVPRLKDARTILVSGRWNGEGMKPGDLAVDIAAGVKGEIEEVDNRKIMHSALASIVKVNASTRDAVAIEYLVKYIDVLDSRGSPTNHLIPRASADARRIFSNICLDGVMRAFERMHSDDEETIFQRMCEILDGLHEMGLAEMPFEDGISREMADYLLSNYREKTDTVFIKEVLRFFDLKFDALKNSERLSVVDLMIGGESDETRKIFAKNSIDAILAVLRYVHRKDDKIFFKRAFEILDGFLKMDEVNIRAEAAADLVMRYTNGRPDPEGLVAFVKDRKEKGVGYALRKRGVVVVIYQDGLNMGVVVKGRPRRLKDGRILTAGHPAFRAVVEKAGDPDGLWYLHIAEFLLCNGSEKAPTDVASRVKPEDFVIAGCGLVNQLAD